MVTFVALVLGTFASEDLTCIAAGLLIERGEIGLSAGVLGCTLGIFVSDVGLWGIGRVFGQAALRWRWAAGHLRGPVSQDLGTWLDRHAAGAIVGSRFLPGARLPMYVTAGVVGLSARVFAMWSFVAALAWAPFIVLLTATLGGTFIHRLSALSAFGWLPPIAVTLSMLLALRLARTVASSDRRLRIRARLARWSRWEFWPMWLFYGPVAAWVGLLAFRYRGLSTMTAANPGIPDGGTVGESKADILSNLPSEVTIPFALIPAGAVAERLTRFADHVEVARWTFPMILKPDVGQRGVGVKLVRDMDGVRDYLSRAPYAVIVQPYHPGPFEAGVFYYRMPGWARGRILSVTDKHFPVVVGDGHSTLEELIWNHPRYRMQADTFLSRHRTTLARVLGSGERFQLAIAGNHAQGTLFRDGSALVTPALERRIDDTSRMVPGFFVGRFDIRYSDRDAFMAGRDLAIVELNGATAESTNIYDPSTSLFSAYRQLFRQWSIVFAIGAANRANGARVSSLSRLLELLRAYATTEVAYQISD